MGKTNLTFAGIDIGESGALAFVHSGNLRPSVFPFRYYSIYDLGQMLLNFKPHTICLENPPGYMPGNGKKSIKSLFMNYGVWVGMLESLGLEYNPVTPQTWQRDVGCRTGGDKKVSHRFATKMFPSLKVTHLTADALLIAQYTKMVYGDQECEIY